LQLITELRMAAHAGGLVRGDS